MIGDHQYIGIVVEQFQEGADLLVDIRVVVVDQRLVRITWDVLAVLLIVILPETVMDAVNANFYELKIIPFLSGHQIADHFKMLPRHFVNLIAEPLFVVRTEAFDVYRVLPN